jgi:hypothetical protein
MHLQSLEFCEHVCFYCCPQISRHTGWTS